MPKRPRQHQIEDESRVAFRARLPASWVFRDSVPDYGIDGAVEIFDETGTATGRLFFAQLKATDELDRQKALVVRFRAETFDYYRSLDLPVLIVRYHAPERKIYVRWFHEFDPWYARKIETAKSIAFQLTDHDEWTETTAAKLSSDIDALKQIRSPRVPLPVGFRLAMLDPEIHGVGAPRIMMAIRERAARVAGIITVSTELRANHIGSIEVSNSKVIARLPGKSFTLHTDKGYATSDVLTRLPSDILLSVALALDHAGHSDAAARLITDSAADARIVSDPRVIMRIAVCMARAHRVTEALQLSERLESDQQLSVARLLVIAPLLRGRPVAAGEREYFREFLRRRIDRAEKSGNRLGAAVEHYTLANHLTGSADGLAIHHYNQAARCDLGYWNRPYFVREFAGVLFEARRYRLSSVLYQHAINLGADCQQLFADAVMFRGRYAEALKLFKECVHQGHSDEEWQLKRWLLVNIQEVLRLESQNRETKAALRLAHIEGCDRQTAEQRLEEALHHDALCSRAWFNLGVIRAETDRESAMLCFAAAALTEKGNVTAWANAFLVSLGLESARELGAAIVVAAYQLNGERFTAAVVRTAEEQPPGFDLSGFLDAFNRLVSVVPARPREGLKLRFVSEDAYDEVTIRQEGIDRE